MAVKYQDYYEILGIPRTAAAKEVQAAFRKKARQYHPDVNKSADAAERFKEINEAYEVLRDPEKRQLYDRLGHNWRAGQDFTPPPGWEGGGWGRPGKDDGGFRFEGDLGDFSDFFASVFGGMPGGYSGFTRNNFRTRAGADREAEMTITLEEAFRGVTKNIRLAVPERRPDGGVDRTVREYSVRVPPGVRDGARIRLRGQGSPGPGGGPPGDLYLLVRLAPHPVFRVERDDLTLDLPVTPWEAMLGAKVEVPTPDGSVLMTIPAGAQSGQRFRLRGKGMPRGSGRGDLYAVLQIAVPARLSTEEKALVEKLAALSEFDPRRGRGGK
ncbi:MAG: DnaJ C-terminal domain-containing protein [bacterium]